MLKLTYCITFTYARTEKGSGSLKSRWRGRGLREVARKDDELKGEGDSHSSASRLFAALRAMPISDQDQDKGNKKLDFSGGAGGAARMCVLDLLLTLLRWRFRRLAT